MFVLYSHLRVCNAHKVYNTNARNSSMHATHAPVVLAIHKKLFPFTCMAIQFPIALPQPDWLH